MAVPEVAVIVTSFEMPWHLRRALESIACQKTSRQIEVVVADDGSTDETAQVVAEFAAQAAFPVRFVTHEHTDFHAARCRNDGVRQSSAPHLLFFDGDCVLPPDHIEQHLSAWRPGRVTCGYCVRFGSDASKKTTLDVIRGGDFLTWAPAEQRRILRRMHWKSVFYRLIRHRTKPAFHSGDFSISRADYLRVNGFDEQFQGWGCEDDDFGHRVRAAGMRLVSVLNRTCTFHLWHPPTLTRPQEWKQGTNVAYLQRPIRLTKCLQGCFAREPAEITVQLDKSAQEAVGVHKLIAFYGWKIETSPGARADVELVCRPGKGRFRGIGDCRVLAVLAGTECERSLLQQAHSVLSGGAAVGHADQVRLNLYDTRSFWDALCGGGREQRRAAA
jgi:GT2 family glycosyltransferase